MDNNSDARAVSIDYAIWLANNCSIWAGAYVLKSKELLQDEQDIFYTDSGTDMEKLYKIYKTT